MLAGSSRKVERQFYAAWWERSRGEKMDGEAIERLEDAFWDIHPISYREIMNPGVPETLEELKHLGYRLAVASSSPLDHIEKVLEECGIAGFFEVVKAATSSRRASRTPRSTCSRWVNSVFLPKRAAPSRIPIPASRPRAAPGSTRLPSVRSASGSRSGEQTLW